MGPSGGPHSKIITFPDVDPQLLSELKQALAITIQVNGWPDTYGHQQPEVQIRTGHDVVTMVSHENYSDPFRLHKTERVKIIVGHRVFQNDLTITLLEHGFAREKILTHILAHEAYHSNGGQHLEQGRVPADLFQHSFTSLIRADLPPSVRHFMLHAAAIARPLEIAFEHEPQLPNSPLVQSLTQLKRLATKLDEGAADVYSMMIFHRAFPDDTLPFAQVLTQTRRSIRENVDLNLDHSTNQAIVGTYDNASCLEALLAISPIDWPIDQRQCTAFSLRHAMPFLKKAPLFDVVLGEIDQMENDLERFFSPDLPLRPTMEHPISETSSHGPRFSKWWKRR